ncbi:hypothetical protein [Pseudonocardia sp. 73-21]|uniref:hypothetical protein n=1 Tax=Pseudonocardia sp. 73-21 TaxID=1895809 RepID=UPI00095FD60C|nr:hypothetical protein [Pseudonocardia sp. 73-21]OJY47626.1 MAG: hypothetical protein BGP03_33375 [Pseudonocardia sp. 73-21]TAK32289.1 MAG: hypothetical protein EPO40_02900 [Myxococcaceae bacterium]
MSTEVTCRDTESGESQTVVIENDYVLITDGTCYRASVQANVASGTHTLVVKGRRGTEVRT